MGKMSSKEGWRQLSSNSYEINTHEPTSIVAPSSLQVLRQLQHDRREGKLVSARQECLNFEECESAPIVTPSSLHVLRQERLRRATEKKLHTRQGRLDFTKLYVLHLQVILWLPTAAFMALIYCIYDAKPSWFDTYSHESLGISSRRSIGSVASGSF
jgi:hypothetical protein